MRHLFLVLLFANLMVFGWQQWVRPESERPVASNPVPELQVYAETRGTPGVSRAPAACQRIGPFPDDAAMRRAREELANRGIDASAVQLPGRVWIGRWVLVEGFADAAAANAARQRLAGAGVPEAAVMDDAGRIIVSIGVFQAPDGVRRVTEAAGRAGLRVVTRDRFRDAMQPWLVVTSASALPPLDALLGDARILRSEAAQCPAGTPPGA